MTAELRSEAGQAFVEGGVWRKTGPDGSSSRAEAVRAEGICVENEEVKEASVVRVKSGCGKAVQDEAEERPVLASVTGSDKHECLHPF